MSLFQPKKKGSLFEALDPRVRLLWMMAISTVVLAVEDPWAVVSITLTMPLTWLSAKRFRLYLKSSLGLIPFLVFLGVFQAGTIYFTVEVDSLQMLLEQVLLDTAAFYVLIASALLVFSTTNYGEVAAAIRSAKRPKAPLVWNRFVEMAAFVVSTGYQTVPLLIREVQSSAEVMRARGAAVNEGHAFERSKRLVTMTNPLFLRMLQLTRNMIMAIFNFSYVIHPRSQYLTLKFKLTDWVTLLVMLAASLLLLFLG